jgi:hypothetical protein
MFSVTREAKRCIAYEMDKSRGRSLLVVLDACLSGVPWDIGSVFVTSIILDLYVENNTTQQEISRNTKVQLGQAQSCCHMLPASLFTGQPQDSSQPLPLHNALQEAAYASRRDTILHSLHHEHG